jgi:hypothetical protein
MSRVWKEVARCRGVPVVFWSGGAGFGASEFDDVGIHGDDLPIGVGVCPIAKEANLERFIGFDLDLHSVVVLIQIEILADGIGLASHQQ